MSDILREETALDVGSLRQAIQEEYAEVAANPTKGFHFHTGRSLARLLEYPDEWLIGIPESAIESFAGTGNPFSLGELRLGERVVDVGCGAGIDSLIAAKKVGPDGKVIGVDMTSSEALPVRDSWADVVISNGVLNLMPDKAAALEEMSRILKPGGRLQIGDILVQKAVPEEAKRKIDLWTG